MDINLKLYSLLFFLIIGKFLNAQKNDDSVTLVREYEKVMAFALKPTVYYTTVTTMQSQPILNETDTGIVTSVFYKNIADIYSGSNIEEMYLQDSLLVNVDHQRKSIWIIRVDTVSKKKLLNQNVIADKLTELSTEGYSVSKKVLTESNAILHFENKKNTGENAFVTTSIDINYDSEKYLPKTIALNVYMKEPVTDEMMEVLKEQNVEVKDLIQTIDSVQYFIRKQGFFVQYKTIDTDNKQKIPMPLWENILTYDKVADDFITTNNSYVDYEITKMF